MNVLSVFKVPDGRVWRSLVFSRGGLKRELLEEAGATISNWSRLGSFQIEGITRSLQEIHDFYWCRVTLADEWIPNEDISERVLVPPGELLDVLPWGRTDPKAAFLLSKALESERALGQ